MILYRKQQKSQNINFLFTLNSVKLIWKGNKCAFVDFGIVLNYCREILLDYGIINAIPLKIEIEGTEHMSYLKKNFSNVLFYIMFWILDVSSFKLYSISHIYCKDAIGNTIKFYYDVLCDVLWCPFHHRSCHMEHRNTQHKIWP